MVPMMFTLFKRTNYSQAPGIHSPIQKEKGRGITGHSYLFLEAGSPRGNYSVVILVCLGHFFFFFTTASSANLESFTLLQLTV